MKKTNKIKLSAIMASVTIILTSCGGDGAIYAGPSGKLTSPVESTAVKPLISFKHQETTVTEVAGDVPIALMLSDKSEFPVSLKLELSGTATNGADYILNGDSELVFLPGETEKRVVVSVLPDDIPETGETIVLRMINIEGADDGEYLRSSIIVLGDVSLNDTGLVKFSPDADAGGQDGSFGRDKNSSINSSTGIAVNGDQDGLKGFSFVKLDAHGNPLPASAGSWSCVSDKVTGLVWENKESAVDNTDLSQLLSSNEWRANNFRYLWRNNDAKTNGGDAGVIDSSLTLDPINPRSDLCGYSAGSVGTLTCDTSTYIAVMNSSGLCGFNDWRLPNVNELQSLANLNKDNGNATPDKKFFLNVDPSAYLSSTPAANNSSAAWCFDYSTGESKLCVKRLNGAERIMLVRNKQ